MMLMAAFCMGSDVLTKQSRRRGLYALGLAMVVLTAQAQTVQVACPEDMVVGQRYTLQLKAKLSTGYRWILMQPTEDLHIHESDPEPMGSEGGDSEHVLQTWKMQAQRPLATDLVWVYARPEQLSKTVLTASCHLEAK